MSKISAAWRRPSASRTRSRPWILSRNSIHARDRRRKSVLKRSFRSSIRAALAAAVSAVEGGSLCRTRSAEGDLHHFVGAGAARGRDLDTVADGLADEGAGERRGHRKTPLTDVGFILTDDLIGHFLVSLFIGQRHRRAE